MEFALPLAAAGGLEVAPADLRGTVALVLKTVLFLAVVKALVTFHKPVFCALVFGAGAFALHLLAGTGLGRTAWLTLGEFLICLALCALLNRAEGAVWWALLVLGAVALWFV